MTPADLDNLAEVAARIHETAIRLHERATGGETDNGRLWAQLRRSLGQMVQLLEDGPRQLRDTDFPPIVERLRRGPELVFTALSEGSADTTILARGDNFSTVRRITDTEPGGAA